uniref:Uncharacterized protein n=1 Tax=Rhizophora mucronata TaxID=61149 RepID=A0A2P2N497_RHIMU
MMVVDSFCIGFLMTKDCFDPILVNPVLQCWDSKLLGG